MNERQVRQQSFEDSGDNLIVGDVSDCPIPLEELVNINENSEYVVSVFNTGLTAIVYRISIDGVDYTLKKRRDVSKVDNPDGRFSFLNEVQRRRDLVSYQHNSEAEYKFPYVVNTIYANYRLGIILSEWIEGTEITEVTDKLVSQLFETLRNFEYRGLFEWDLSSGNLLVDQDGNLKLFDFGYMYQFDPKSEHNSNGLSDPIFNFCERFETRFLSGWIIQNHICLSDALTIYSLIKSEAIKQLGYKLKYLIENGSSELVIMKVREQIEQYKYAIASPNNLESLYRVEMFRSNVLDIEDDLEGKSCTPTTLDRIDQVMDTISSQYEALVESNSLFYQNEGKTKAELLESYREKRTLCLLYQL